MKLGEMQKLIDKARQDERAECAYIADVVASRPHLYKDPRAAAKAIARQIRERGDEE